MRRNQIFRSWNQENKAFYTVLMQPSYLKTVKKYIKNIYIVVNLLFHLKLFDFHIIGFAEYIFGHLVLTYVNVYFCAVLCVSSATLVSWYRKFNLFKIKCVYIFKTYKHLTTFWFIAFLYEKLVYINPDLEWRRSPIHTYSFKSQHW